MNNRAKEYAAAINMLDACVRGCCADCSVDVDEVAGCISGNNGILMHALKAMEATRDWMHDNGVWTAFVREDDTPETDEKSEECDMHKHAEEMHENADAMHPDHYNSGEMQAWDAMEAAFGKEAVQHFCLCNAMKYIWRQERKNGREDVGKAIVYLRKWMELEEKC